MLDRGLVLRFLAFYEQGYEKASSGLKAFLNRFFEVHREASDSILTEFEQRFKASMRSSVSVFGSHAFRIRQHDKKGGGDWAARVNASIFQVISTSFAKYEHHEIVKRADAVLETYLDLQTDQRWIDGVSKATGDYQNIKYAFDAWFKRMDDVMSGSEARTGDRVFTQSLKKELFANDHTCAICGQAIASVYDAALDHVEEYWLGGSTIPSNARLVHRICNLKRPKTEVRPSVKKTARTQG